MEPKLQVLSLFLQELGEETEINSLDDRMRLQKAVYIGQVFGVDLGYRYSWYVKGPYSPPLAQDYYELTEAVDDELVGLTLHPEVKDKLSKARECLKLPPNVQELSTAQWYELLASLHYLYKVSGQSAEKVRETIQRTKAHLVQWVAVGEDHLKQHHLLPT